MIKFPLRVAIVCLLVAATSRASEQTRRTVVFDGVATAVNSPAGPSKDLWLTLQDLTRATKFALKPQGVCRDELCFPIPKTRKAEFISKKGGVTWFNLSEFARLLKQPVAADETRGVWYFGARPDAQNARLESLEAPDFTLPDMNGKPHSLKDYRGKKVLLLTWASW
jgi:hypothetical protein